MKNLFYFTIIVFISSNLHAGSPAFDSSLDGAPTLGYKGAATGTQSAADLANAGNDSMFKKFKDGCSNNPVLCGMAVLTGYQIVTTLMGSKDSKKIADQTQCTGSYCGSGGNSNTDTVSPPGFGNNPPGDGLNPQEQALVDKTKNGLKDLAGKGYTYDADKNAVNTPNGSVPASAYSSAEGLKQAGATDAQIKSMEQVLKNSRDAYGSFGYDEGGGGGARGKAKGYADDKGLDMNAYMKSLMGQNGRDVAGLQKRMGTDSIGVAQDNIFQMIHRSYKTQEPSLLSP